MSISRKRVGSVSQRNDSPLPPLDIQSIQMPPNPQNALALKTAALSSTKTLFQMASGLRKRLRSVEDFAPFLEQPNGANQLDVVAHMCHVFRLGSSLCHLYNQLIPSFVNPSSPLYAGDLPEPHPINYDPPNFKDSPEGVRNWAKRPENAKVCQKYIALFCIAMKQRREEGRWHGESWAIHELLGKSTGDESDLESYDSTGLTKVFQTVEAMLDNLPESAIFPSSPTPTTPFGTSSSQTFSALAPLSTNTRSNSRQSYELAYSAAGTPTGSTVNGSAVNILAESEAGPGPSTVEQQRASGTGAIGNAFKTVEELVNSERSYVQELEILERCSVEILKAELVSAETVYSIFSNLRQILDFQRKFLIKLETEYEPIEERGCVAWNEGRFGRPFVDMEKEFECYGPYCANYLDAMTKVNDFMVNLMLGQDLPEGQKPCLHPERELQAFMIKPIQRITKYGLLLDAILHATAKHEYAYREELQAGLAAVRRIAADINETTAFKEKQATIRELVERVDDWKGHDYERFGDLHLDDQFTVSKADSPRDYHVFLFDKMMLCCKEIQPDRKKGAKNNSMLNRKDKTTSKSALPPKSRLALKGRIFVSNITAAHLLPPTEQFGAPRVHIVWSVPAKSGDAEQDVEDSFIMSGRSEETMKKWADKVMELATITRKQQEERSNSTRFSNNTRASDPRGAPYWAQSQFAPPTPATEHGTFAYPPVPGTPRQSENGYYLDGDDDEPVNGLAIYGVPGVPFPVNARRAQSQQSLPAVQQAELRARAMTEDQNGPSMTQWRQQAVPPLPSHPRAVGGDSAGSTGAPEGWRAGPNGRRQHSQSQSRLAGRLDEEEADFASVPPGAFARYEQAAPRGMARAPSNGAAAPQGQQQGSIRSRSASSPNVYQPANNAPLPPLPNGSSPTWHNQNTPYVSGSATSSSTGLGSTPGGTAYFNRRMSTGKRSSAESQTTETSETSSQSPRTPYTNGTPGDMRGATPVSRQNSEEAGPAQNVLVKVRSGESNFVIGIPTDISFQTLYEKVVKKLRLCSAQHANAGLDLVVRIKWLDSDGDEVVIKTDSDVQVMLVESVEEQIQLIAT
ncbi:hypothetical protein VHUM_03711 [Vanrija humicola]|uniref:DH domain-containing protein n=1 Tax=Vanrija humicola TaxID=5417 RepID=A0A7D8ZHN0_VANHU|nr:hypothetical protein VHUM_03711 [Vanrija humicola]